MLHRQGEPEVLHHGGGQVGVSAHFVLVPAYDVACIVLANRRNPTFLASLRDRMLRTVVPDWHGLPSPGDPPLQPLAPSAAYAGTWRGTLRAQGTEVPVVLTIAGDHEGTLAVGTGPAAPIKDLGLRDGQLSGDTQGEIGSPDVRRWHLEQLSLGLVLRGNRVDGEIVAYELTHQHMTTLPYWTALQRDR